MKATADITPDPEPFNILDLLPDDTPDYMTDAWIACIVWAAGEDGIMDVFRADTGFAWIPGKTGIERMIDQATGADQQFVEAFVRWVNVKIWGPVNGPTN